MRRAWILVMVIAVAIGAPGPAPAAAPAASARPVTGSGMASRAASDSEPATYTVFATREGLVGERTANGHTIVERDHFAALPSRRGLSTRDSGERTVRVCAASTGRCAYAPVWDVGPWNTRDDYWNTDREQWTDLPRGKPQAQAAYQDGYNGGMDQFGRVVRNPAGIDLADGTFWDALLLKGNAWVSVTFLWTVPALIPGRVDTAGSPLRLRAGAGTSAGTTGLAARHAQLPIECQVQGEMIAGTVRSTDLWDRVAPGTYVSHAYIAVIAGKTIPRCVA